MYIRNVGIPKTKTAEIYLQVPDSAVMDVTRSIIVVFIGVNFALCLVLVFAVLTPVRDYA